MDRLDRIYTLHQLLRGSRYPVPLARIREKLECARATATRVIQTMRLYLEAPIVYDREYNGYRYDHSTDHPYELPGLWFSAAELHALLVSHELLTRAQPGLLDTHLAPLQRRIEEILASHGLQHADVAHRVRILQMAGRRSANASHFPVVADALLGRQRLRIRYHGRARDDVTERTISPQRLVHYRDNWYLDAWCHRARGLRSFAVERIRSAHLRREAAREIPEVRLEEHFATAYGIFAGPSCSEAVLRFSTEHARWVADEQWHPEQTGTVLSDGCYELRVPYGDPRELIMDVLRHGPDVEVIAPDSLRELVRERLEAARARYR